MMLSLLGSNSGSIPISRSPHFNYYPSKETSHFGHFVVTNPNHRGRLQGPSDLFRLLMHRPRDIAAVRAIMKRNMQCAAMKDDFLNTPLHIACMYGASLEVVKELINGCPDATSMRNFQGFTPLQLAQRGICANGVINLLKRRTQEMSNFSSKNSVKSNVDYQYYSADEESAAYSMLLLTFAKKIKTQERVSFSAKSCVESNDYPKNHAVAKVKTNEKISPKRKGVERLPELRAEMAIVENAKVDKAKMLALYRQCRDIYNDKSRRMALDEQTKHWVRRRMKTVDRIEDYISRFHNGSDSSFVNSYMGWIPTTLHTCKGLKKQPKHAN